MESNGAKRRKLAHKTGPGASTSNATGTSGTSALILETDELLKEVKVNYDQRFPGLNETLRQIKAAVESIDGHEPLPINTVSARLEKHNKITIPYPEPKPPSDSEYKVSFQEPAKINVVGSYVLKSQVNTEMNPAVDMIVVMPESVFQPKDYLNFRYFYKRSYYLAYFTVGLRKTLDSMEFSFEYLNGNRLLPILVVLPKSDPVQNGKTPKAQPSYKINVIPVASEGCFPTAKLSVDSNAIRLGSFAESKPPTPFYNYTLKAECLHSAYLRVFHRAAEICPAFRDCCVLGRIYLHQRGFGGDIADGGFGSFEWAITVALLLQNGDRTSGPTFSPSLNCIQLFKATLSYLASADLANKSRVIGLREADIGPTLHTPPVLYDASREMNLLFKMTPGSAHLLTENVKWSLSAINNNPLEQFDSLFITKVNQPFQMYDLILRVKTPPFDTKTNAVDGRGNLQVFCDELHAVLKVALTDRAQYINIEAAKINAWPLSSRPTPDPDTILVGINCDPKTAARPRDYGPSYEEKEESERFRKFWGDKSKLWQFPDGSIVESLDWAEFGLLGWSGICEAIIRCALKLHTEVAGDSLEFLGREYSKIIPAVPADKQAFDDASRSFEKLEQDIRDLGDLPLHIRQITPTAPELRHASLQAPNHNSRDQSSRPMEVVVSFEASGRWPESLPAIQKAKTALLVKIGEGLEEDNESIRTHLGLERTARAIQNLAFLDVVYETGFSFRIRIHCDLEETLLDREVKGQKNSRHARTEAAEVLASLRRMCTNLSLQNQAISTCCTRFPALSSSIRTVKLWFSKHKLINHVSQELIELFVLQAFLQPYPFPAPSSAMTGALRTLHLLAKWDWRDEPFIVDHSTVFSSSQRMEIDTRFKAWRKMDPHMNKTILFVATSFDNSGTAFTADGPSKVVATRMTSLARAASKAVKDKGVDLDVWTLFQPSLRDYDVLIHLSAKHLRALSQQLSGHAKKQSRFKNLLGGGSGVGAGATAGSERNGPSSSFPPLSESPLELLLDRFDEAFRPNPLVFFHGGEDDTVIGALWHPDARADKGSTVAALSRIGGEFVEKIVLK